MTDRRVEMVAGLYQPEAGAPLWHGGATVLGSVRGVQAAAAAWRPAPGRHSIWELTLHVTYWKYAVLRRLSGGELEPFPRSPADWPAQPDDAGEAQWKDDRALLRTYHEALREVIRTVPSDRLDDHAGGTGKYTHADLMAGIVLHDVYHTGQIQMLKRIHGALEGEAG